jgi:multidrug transporter EmrE-like cation transporter
MEVLKRIFGTLAGAVAGFVVSVIFVMIAQGGITLSEVVSVWTILGAVIGGVLGFIFPEEFLNTISVFFPF